MATIVRSSACSPHVKRAVASALFSLRPWELHDERKVIRAIWYWVKGTVKFVPDESVVAETFGIPLHLVEQELLITPDRLLTMRQPRGDCDDFSMLIATMLECVGIPADLVAIKADTEQQWRYSHVYVRAILRDGSRLPLDASHGPMPGWESRINFGEIAIEVPVT